MIIIGAWWDQITVSKETMLTAVPLTEKKLNLFVKLVTPKIEFHQILRQKANRNSVVSPIKPNQRYIAISNKWRYNNQEKRIIFQRGLLDWLLPIWTLPCVCVKYVIKCRLFTRNWHATWENCMEIHYQMHLVPCEFFQWGWTMQVEYVMKWS